MYMLFFARKSDGLKGSLLSRKEKRILLAKRSAWLESKESKLTSRGDRERARRGSETATEKLSLSQEKTESREEHLAVRLQR